MVNTLKRPTPLKRWLNSPSKLQMLWAFVIANRGWKASSHFLQNVWKRSSVSCAHLSPHIHTAYVERCGNINIQNSTCTEHRHYRHMQTRARTSWHLKGWEKMSFFWTSASFDRLVGLVVRRPPWERKILGLNRACAGIFFRVESYQWLKNWHSSDYHARRLALEGQCWDWLARCQYTVTGWDGKFGLQLLSEWQHVKLSEQIRPWDTLACGWDIRQPTSLNFHPWAKGRRPLLPCRPLNSKLLMEKNSSKGV